MPPPAEDGLRKRFGRVAHAVESALYVALAVLLVIGAISALMAAAAAVWTGFRGGTLLSEAFVVLEHLLLVLIFVEILHTVRISIHSHALVMEPFLIVGLIASVRRILVITMQAANLAQKGDTQPVEFRNSMIELALLGFLILVFAVSIWLLRRAPQSSEQKVEM